MVLKQAVDPVMERLVAAWHDAEAIRDMPELFTEDKLAQIANATMAAIEEAWEALGHSRRERKDAGRRSLAAGELGNGAGHTHWMLECAGARGPARGAPTAGAGTRRGAAAPGRRGAGGAAGRRPASATRSRRPAG